MYITFSYRGDTGHLKQYELSQFAKDLADCTRPDTWENFYVDGKTLELDGGYDDQDGYCDDAHDIEYVLDKYEIDWSGRAKESPIEPDWDKMPGGYDDCLV